MDSMQTNKGDTGNNAGSASAVIDDKLVNIAASWPSSPGDNHNPNPNSQSPLYPLPTHIAQLVGGDMTSGVRAAQLVARSSENGFLRSGSSMRPADLAARLPLPRNVRLKDPKDFQLIGTPAKTCIDKPTKVSGQGPVRIDVKIPGMKIPTVTACPVRGGSSPASTTARRGDQRRSVRCLRLRRRSRQSSPITWGGAARLYALEHRPGTRGRTRASECRILRRMEAACTKPGAVARKEGMSQAQRPPRAQKIEVFPDARLRGKPKNGADDCPVKCPGRWCDNLGRNQVVGRPKYRAAEGCPARVI